MNYLSVSDFDICYHKNKNQSFVFSSKNQQYSCQNTPMGFEFTFNKFKVFLKPDMILFEDVNSNILYLKNVKKIEENNGVTPDTKVLTVICNNILDNIEHRYTIIADQRRCVN